MAELIKNYILERQNNKEIRLLKDKPEKGVGGINHKLFETTMKYLTKKKHLTKEEIKALEEKIKEEVDLCVEQKLYGLFGAVAERHAIDIKSIVDEYKWLVKNTDNQQNKKMIAMLKNKPKKGEGGINHKLIETIKKHLSNEEVDAVLAKIKDETSLRTVQKKYDILVSIAERYAIDIKNIIDEYQELLQNLEDEHDFNTWLSKRAEKANGVSLATHVIKLTHSGISGASCFYDKGTVQNNAYLTTAHIQRPVIDGAYNNAADAPIATLLQLKNEDGSLADQILAGNYSGLAPFANNNNARLEHWVAGFKQALDNPTKSSHLLAKQVYFPVADNEYHLLSNVTSSSLCHELFVRFQKYRSDEEKVIRDRRYNGKYSPKLFVSYPNKAVIKVTARQHQNVSMLNGKRAGRLTMLSCQPPIWKSNLKPPANKRSLFYGEINYRSFESVRQLQRLLLAVKTKKLSANNPKIHARLSALVEEIVDILFYYVASIQNLVNQAGWSENAKKLKSSHQLWLDPFRDEEEFQQQRKSIDWQSDICRDFSLWLNKRLDHKKLTLGKLQEAFWQKIFKPRLREFNTIMEANR